jgi:tRNA (cmo5U34)-methyltransferase
MPINLENKSTIDEIRQRFDTDVERFSNLDTGQQTTIDAPLSMELIVKAATATNPKAECILDIGCGAGNNTVQLLRTLGRKVHCDLCDLSEPMLSRALIRVIEENYGTAIAYVGDFRTLELKEKSYDIIIAAAVFHHLRDDKDWEQTFTKVYKLLKPGGSLWISDLITHQINPCQQLMWNRYYDYLKELNGEDYAKEVFEYIDKEDSPRPLTYQLELLRQVGFSKIDVLHKNSCFATFGGIK